MNKKLFSGILLAASIFSFNENVFATNHQIAAGSNNLFSPATLNVMVGDTITWTLTGGFHTTTSLTIPPTAQPWNDTLATTFSYVVTVPGVYNYECLFHTPMMPGQFTAVNPTSIANIAQASFSLSPNPATNEIKLIGNVKQIRITAYDLSGRKVRELKTINANTSERIYSLEGMLQGYYMLYIKADDAMFTEKLLIVR